MSKIVRESTYNVSFRVDFKEIDAGEKYLEVNPSIKFIKGCLYDLQNSHGLNCRRVKIDEVKDEVS